MKNNGAARKNLRSRIAKLRQARNNVRQVIVLYRSVIANYTNATTRGRLAITSINHRLIECWQQYRQIQKEFWEEGGYKE